MSTPVIVVGGSGRLGRSIVDAAPPTAFAVAAVVARTEPVRLGGSIPWYPELGSALRSHPDAIVVDCAPGTMAASRFSAARGRPLVVGSTGLDAAARSALTAHAAHAPLVLAPNFSIGIALLQRMLALVVSSGEWDLGIVDRHHRAKRDAPSGTARQLTEAVQRLGGPAPDVVSLRQGDVVGEHTVYCAGTHEELILTHRATSREVFARGAWRAVVFCAGASAGAYGMEDVLGLTPPTAQGS